MTVTPPVRDDRAIRAPQNVSGAREAQNAESERRAGAIVAPIRFRLHASAEIHPRTKGAVDMGRPALDCFNASEGRDDDMTKQPQWFDDLPENARNRRPAGER